MLGDFVWWCCWWKKEAVPPCILESRFSTFRAGLHGVQGASWVMVLLVLFMTLGRPV